MLNSKKSFVSVLLIVVMGVLAVLPAAAQEVAPANTITVTGVGVTNAAPTQANIELGVEIFGTSVTEAFAQSNETIRAIYDALIGLGIAEEDIQTANLSVYSSSRFNMESGSDTPGYQVNNTVRVLIRDIAQVDAVVDAAINAGATAMYGLTFSIAETAGLETEARAAAFEQAQARAAELAGLAGATLGNVVSVTEVSGGMPFYTSGGMGRGGGADSAFIAPGQNEVNVTLQVTFAITR